MSYVIYDATSIHIIKTVKTSNGAKRACEALCNKGRNAVWTDQENFDKNINYMTTTYNMLDPDRKPIPIRIADKGGCCDPATERYHCM
jgi:hypothetical protein